MTFLNTYLFTHGKRIVLFLIALFTIGYMLNNFRLKILSVILFIFTYYFFRIPRFETRRNNHIVYAPCFGKVIKSDLIMMNNIKYHRICTFISLTNPHIQYMPVEGYINRMKYIKGEFNPAMIFKKSSYNERLHYYINSYHGNFIVTQIAGMLARTIVPFVRPKQLASQGSELGLIKFGSRCDIYIPYKDNLKIIVREGDSVLGGQTIFGAYV